MMMKQSNNNDFGDRDFGKHDFDFDWNKHHDFDWCESPYPYPDSGCWEYPYPYPDSGCWEYPYGCEYPNPYEGEDPFMDMGGF